MQILNLKLLNFRNYEKLELQFNPYKNIIIGKNGMGKTNIVEAIYVLALTKSFRGSKEDVIIKYNSDLARIEGTIKDKYKDNYKVIIKNNEKKVKINNTNIDRLSDYLSKINIVLFTSEDLKLIVDTPSTRRKLINIELSQFSNEYLKLLTLYNKVLKQRNTYLKKIYGKKLTNYDYLDILTNQLIEIGIKINKYRKVFINNISKYIGDFYLKITKNEGLRLVYKSDYNNKTKEQLINKYKSELERDIILGKTNIGIHHDDYDFYLLDKNIKDFGSKGEQKNAIISLKLAEISIFQEEKKVNPILILDDLFSELDQQKINNILKFINEDIQTFITTTDLKKVSKKLMENSKVFKISKGTIEEEEYEK